MPTVSSPKRQTKPFVLTERMEKILRAVHFYRYMTALDVAHLLYSPSSLTHVRSVLSALSGQEDFKANQYLFRFQLPTTGSGTKEKVFTLGWKGRNFLDSEIGLAVDWHFRPHKVKHLSHGQILHNLVLTRFLVAASYFAKCNPDFKLTQIRTCYELAKIAPTVTLTTKGGNESVKVIPDTWLLFERLTGNTHDAYFPVLLEIDRGREYQQKFKSHVRGRIDFIKKGGGYSQVFGQPAVTIAYVTTGERPEYREARRIAMCRWTQEVLEELKKDKWASVFRFHSLSFEEIYTSRIFEEPVWFRPDSNQPVRLFTP
jgi:hypothetical protein